MSDYHGKGFIQGNQDIQPEQKTKMEWLPIIVGIGTITMAILKAIIYIDLNSWTLERLILEHSEDTSLGLFLWKTDDLCSESFKEIYGSNLNGINCTLGTFGLMAAIFCNMSVDLAKDMLIWVAIVNKNQILRFGTKIKENLHQKKTTGKNLEETDDQCWQAYRETLEMNSVTNSTFSLIYLIIHLHSFLVASYWLTQVLNKKVKLRVLLLVGYNVMKGIFSYFPAIIAATEVCVLLI